MNNNEETVGERKPTERETAPKFFYAFFGYFEIVCLSLVAVLVFFSFGARLCRVVGDSMNQTLKDGEQLVTSDLFYTPKVGDVIVFHLCNEYYEEPLVKRVIATEGQEVYINFNTGEVRVDGAAIDEDYVYLEGGEYRLRTDFDPEYVDLERGILQATVPEGHVFVMGDNRNNSSDSRSYLVGFVDERTILGRALFRIKPFTSLAK
jgi:signal peptidase I